MRDLLAHHSPARLLLGALAIAALGAAIAWPAPEAAAKGPIKFRLCGERGCVTKKSGRFTAVMMYGGRHHAGPSCGARVHSVTARIPGRHGGERRYLLRRGLIGEQGKNGYVWWRRIGGERKALLIRVAGRTGRGFAAGTHLKLTGFSAARPKPTGLTAARTTSRWRLRSEQITCEAGRAAPDARRA